MNKLNDFEFKVCNKEIAELSFEDAKEIFSDCVFIGVSVELGKLSDIVKAISFLPTKEEQEVVWQNIKDTLKDVFAKATVAIAPRYHICEMPIQAVEVEAVVEEVFAPFEPIAEPVEEKVEEPTEEVVEPQPVVVETPVSMKKRTKR